MSISHSAKWAGRLGPPSHSSKHKSEYLPPPTVSFSKGQTQLMKQTWLIWQTEWTGAALPLCLIFVIASRGRIIASGRDRMCQLHKATATQLPETSSHCHGAPGFTTDIYSNIHPPPDTQSVSPLCVSQPKFYIHITRMPPPQFDHKNCT
jgi:hypothetical protein